MSIKKQYLQGKPICKVTFRLPKKTAGNARMASIAGEFNNWKPDETPMKALKNGDFTVTMSLAAGHEYQYRFVVDSGQWITDECADKFVNSGFGDTSNSVVVV